MVTGPNPAATAMRRNPDLYQALFEGANDAIVILEPRSETILEANRKACELYGFCHDELVGMSLKTLTKDVPRGARQIRQLLREGKYDLFQTVHFNRGGEEIPILANSSVVDYRGQPAILSINRDVSELRRIEEALRRSNDELEIRVRSRTAELEAVNHALQAEMRERKRTEEQLRQAQKLEAIGRLAGGVAHDFNNILMLILGYAGALLNHTRDNTPARTSTENILKAAERARSLTRQLLAFARKQVMTPKVLDLNAVLLEFNKMLPRLLGEDVHVVFQPGNDLGRIKADPAQIELAVMNLALNARDAMPCGGTLTLATRNACCDEIPAHVPAGAYVALSIRDTGHGMDEKTKAKIFEPFFSTKGTSKGTGLGLASVHGIVSQTGGFITVESEIGRGTCFHVYLPAVEGEPEPEQEDLPLQAPPGHEVVLLVEDEPGIRNLSRAYLESNGYTVLEAANGHEALEIAESYPGNIELLITDVIMPGMRGTELAAHLKVRRRGMKVLYVSGFADMGISCEARVLEKPFAFETLGVEIRQILDNPRR